MFCVLIRIASLRWDFFQGSQERVRNNRGKRTISVRATEDLLYTEVDFTKIEEFLIRNIYIKFGGQIIQQIFDISRSITCYCVCLPADLIEWAFQRKGSTFLDCTEKKTLSFLRNKLEACQMIREALTFLFKK